MKLLTNITHIPTPGGRMKLIILRPAEQSGPLPGILWIHGGGYTMGMAEMVHFSVGKLLAEKFGAVVVSPEYRLAGKAPFPAAFDDCCSALDHMYRHADKLQIRPDQLIVGGESAGGGLAAAVCLWARDEGRIPVAFQLPLYPMLDCDDTPSSADNYGYVWNTSRNHWGWQNYLGPLYGSKTIPKYASPAKETNYKGLPPAYTFVCEGEPFYDETLTYVQNLRAAGVPANVDIYPGKTHAFDMLLPWTENARKAKARVCEVFGQALHNEFRF